MVCPGTRRAWKRGNADDNSGGSRAALESAAIIPNQNIKSGTTQQEQIPVLSEFSRKILYIRDIQGHTGGEMIEPEMMGDVCIPLNWKQFVFHRGCSCDLKSILGGGLIAGRREGRDNRHTVFFTPLNPWGTEDVEKFHDDLTQRTRVHYETGWNHSQDAVYWIHVGRAQEKSTAFWQPKLHAIIAYHPFPPDKIERVISQRGDMTIYQRSSTPRLAPRIVLKSTWHEQQQQAAASSSLHSKSCGKLQQTQYRPEFMEFHKTSSTKTRDG